MLFSQDIFEESFDLSSFKGYFKYHSIVGIVGHGDVNYCISIANVPSVEKEIRRCRSNNFFGMEFDSDYDESSSDESAGSDSDVSVHYPVDLNNPADDLIVAHNVEWKFGDKHVVNNYRDAKYAPRIINGTVIVEPIDAFFLFFPRDQIANICQFSNATVTDGKFIKEDEIIKVIDSNNNLMSNETKSVVLKNIGPGIFHGHVSCQTDR